MDFNTYKDNLLSYLYTTEEYEKQDIEDQVLLSDDEKEELGYMIKEAVVTKDDGKGNVELSPGKNNTKWRVGDMVRFSGLCQYGISGTATITDNFENCICLTGMPADSLLMRRFSLSYQEPKMTGVFISAIETIEDGCSGSFFIEELAEVEKADKEFGTPIKSDDGLLSHLNQQQQEAVMGVLKRPSLYAIQGPPGTGKTGVLSAIAKMYSDTGRNVLVICNSHQAVNNALNKISQYDVPTFKIGNEFKAVSLDDKVMKFPGMWEYTRYRNKHNSKRGRNQKTPGDVVGMTLCGSILSLVFHGHAFTPSIVLVDEASQIPLGLGAAIAALEGGTYVFIGDDRQMPPIFHEKMVGDPLSVSIFDHLQKILPNDLKTTLTTTYRMNSAICRYVSEQFYEPYGVTLTSHPSIADNHIEGEELANSIEFINVDSNNCEDFNRAEAQEAVRQALKYNKQGLEVAIITPYRKQVNLVREEWANNGGKSSDILIDTVERLQGQDVDVIILTMSVSDIEYYKIQYTFLLNKNRLNVMISRAKLKVIIVKSPIITFSEPTNTNPAEMESGCNGMFVIE